jgi:hypothetical protein
LDGYWAAGAAGLSAADVDSFVGRIVDFTPALIAKTCVEDAKKEAVTAQGLFLGQLATFLDGRMWDEAYQFIFCLWGRRMGGA